MVNVLKMKDVIDMGIEKEKARRDFYGRAAETFDDPEFKSLFLQLRDWEAEHIRTFEAFKTGVPDEKPAESYTGEWSAYLDALVDDRLYRDVQPETFAKSVKTPGDAIRYGVSFEKDAILFFLELMPYIQPGGKDILSKIIEEERSHIRYLIRLKGQLSC
ncbi:ferritin family protein [bacterium]|nr:ferritin family protein [bacterium]